MIQENIIKDEAKTRLFRNDGKEIFDTDVGYL